MQGNEFPCIPPGPRFPWQVTRAKVETAEEDTSRHMGLVRQEAPIVSDPLQRIPAGKMDAFGADQRNIVDAEGLLFGGIFFCRRF